MQMWRKNSWCLGIIFLILLSSCVLANCDWKVEILSENIFEKSEYVNWTVKVSRIEGNNSDIIIKGYVKDILSNWTKDYDRTLSNVANYRNIEYSPNLWQGSTYSIWFNIGELNCNDTDLENNFDEKLIIVLPEYFGQDYTKLKINELFPDPQGYDNAAMPEGEWVELYNAGEENLDLKNLGLKDDYGQDTDILISDSNTLNGTIIEANDYFVIYMNGRSGFLNNDGFEKISLYKDDYLIDEVSYSGSIEGLTWGKADNVWKLTLPTPNSVNFYNESVNESSLKIENTYKETFKFGEIIRAKIHVYKGDTEKYSIQAWVEDEDDNEISKRSRSSLYRKFTDYDIILPIQIFSNCEGKYEEGEYTVIVDGLGLIDKENINIEGNDDSMCGVIEKEVIKETGKSSLGLNEKDINTTYSIEYASKEVKERRLAIYFFCVILIMMLIYFGLSKNE